jgi:hypothetical protein
LTLRQLEDEIVAEKPAVIAFHAPHDSIAGAGAR